MKRTVLSLSVLIFTAGAIYVYTARSQAQVSQSGQIVNLKAQPSKASFILGELVPMEISLRNEGTTDVMLRGFDIKSGYLRVWIADSAGNYAEYTNASWGNAKTPPVTLKAGREVVSQATILANSIPEIGHLSSAAANRASEGKILTKYAFPKAGTYYIKAVLLIPGAEPTKVESAPIQITITDPIGEDLEVWDKMKDRTELAYFIQEGQVITTIEREKTKFLSEVDHLVANYPNSLLVNQIGFARDRFRANEAKRKEMSEKVKSSN